MRISRPVLVAVAAGLLSLGASAAHATLIIDSYLQGWVRSDGIANGAVDGNNTFTGNEAGLRFNSWAAFDLSSVTQSAGSAAIDITTRVFPIGSSATYQLGIYDVSTPLAGLSGAGAYTDLGTGTLYATGLFGEGTHLVLTLPAQAVADINAALGGTFIIGFTNVTLNGVPSGATDDFGLYTNNYDWANGGQFAPGPLLVLEPVPEPGTMLLLGTGLVGFVIRRRRRA